MMKKIFAQFTPHSPSSGLRSRTFMVLTLTLTVLFGMSINVLASEARVVKSQQKPSGLSSAQSVSGHTVNAQAHAIAVQHTVTSHAKSQSAGHHSQASSLAHPEFSYSNEGFFGDFSYVPNFGGGFECPDAITNDNNGNFYVADNCAGAVYEESPNGDGTWTQTLVQNGFVNITSLAYDNSQSLVWVLDAGENYGYAYQNTGSGFNYWGYSGPFEYPLSIAVDANGDVFVADAEYPEVYYFNNLGGGSYGTNYIYSGNYPISVGLDAEQNVYIGDFNTSGHYDTHIFELDYEGGTSYSSPSELYNSKHHSWGYEHLKFWWVSGITISPNGTMYITDEGSGGFNTQEPAVYQVYNNQNGYYTPFQISSPYVNYNLESPYGGVLDSLGNFYTTDPEEGDVYEYSQTFGTVPVGMDNGSDNYVTANFVIEGAVTLGQVQALSQGDYNDTFYTWNDSCSGQVFTSGGYCTVTVGFDPYAPGPTSGSIQLVDIENNVIAATPSFFGEGLAPRTSFFPGTTTYVYNSQAYAKPAAKTRGGNPNQKPYQAAKGEFNRESVGDTSYDSTFKGYFPNGIAVDSYGDMFVADTAPGVCTIWWSPDYGTSWFAQPEMTVTSYGFNLCPTGPLTIDGSGNVIFGADFNDGGSWYRDVVAISYNLNYQGFNGYTGNFSNGEMLVDHVNTGDGQLYDVNAVAVDGNDNVYFTGSDDNNYDYVYFVPAGNWVGQSHPSSGGVSRLPGYYEWAPGIAADNQGDIYVTDYYYGYIWYYQYQANGLYGDPLAIARGLDTPAGISLDAAGNLYVIDSGDDSGVSVLYLLGYNPGAFGYNTYGYYLEPLSSSIYPENGVYYWNFTTDLNNNFYITNGGIYDYGNITEINVSNPPSVIFDSAYLGQISDDSPEVVLLFNSGNDTNGLDITAPTSGSNPSVSYNFLLDSTYLAFAPGGYYPISDCPLLTTGSSDYFVSSDGACALPVSFVPQTAGTDDGTLVVTSNSLYGSSPYGYAVKGSPAKGLARAAGKKHLSLAMGKHGKIIGDSKAHPLSSSTASQTLDLSGTGDAVTPNVQLLSATNPAAPSTPVNFTVNVTGPGAVPTGTVVLFYNNLQIGTGTLNANGSILFSVSTLPVGTDPIHATYVGDNNYLQTNSAVLNEVIAQPTPTVTLLSSAPPPSSQLTLNPVTFSVSVTGTSVIPTGTITLYDGATSVASGTLVNGQAAFTLTTLPIGTDPITAVYSGDGNYLTATSAVLNQAITDFSVTITGPISAKPPVVKAGQAFVIDFTVAPNAPATAIPTDVTLTAFGAPENTGYTFSQTTVPAGSGATSVTLTINVPVSFLAKNDLTTNPTDHNKTKLPVVPLALALLLLPMAGKLRKAGKRMGRMAAMLLLAIAGITATASLIGCGDSTKVLVDVTITGTSGFDSHTSAISVVVEN